MKKSLSAKRKLRVVGDDADEDTNLSEEVQQAADAVNEKLHDKEHGEDGDGDDGRSANDDSDEGEDDVSPVQAVIVGCKVIAEFVDEATEDIVAGNVDGGEREQVVEGIEIAIPALRLLAEVIASAGTPSST
jgi:hypothetical protein